MMTGADTEMEYVNRPLESCNVNKPKETGQFTKNFFEQECIPVGCVPPARRLYLPGPGGGYNN